MDAVINPYANVDWESVEQIVSISHAHSRLRNNDGTKGTVYQRYLDNAVNDGAKHIAFSNYYPSEPFYPLSDWFESVPDDVIASPNAEHHNIIGWDNLHINGLGCTYSSGQAGGLTPVGINMSAEASIKAILGTLQYDDGGGITLNHPGWSVAQVSTGWVASNCVEMLMKLLTIDERVLGIEIQNTQTLPVMIGDTDYEANDTTWWDEILMTGKRCWGFCVPDHETEWGAKWSGRNILLVDSFDEHECLKAYRNGNFYSKVFDSDLAFDNVSYSDNHFVVSAPNADTIKVIIDGETTSINSNSADVIVPNGATFVRAEAWMAYNWIDRNGVSHEVTDKIFTNPIMFKAYAPKKNNANSIENFMVLMN